MNNLVTWFSHSNKFEQYLNNSSYLKEIEEQFNKSNKLYKAYALSSDIDILKCMLLTEKSKTELILKQYLSQNSLYYEEESSIVRLYECLNIEIPILFINTHLIDRLNYYNSLYSEELYLELKELNDYIFKLL